MIAELVNALGSWSWFVLGLVLLGLEVVVSGTFLLWFGLAALVVGSVALMVDLGWQVELVAFGVLSIVFLVLGRRFMKARVREEVDPAPGLNMRGARHIGHTLTLSEPLTGGEGRTKIGDTLWRIAGPDLAEGVKVKVVSAEGALLHVEPV
ncbi:MAG: NfeD family protein [Hyphomicrobiaceae bacterium]|nr:NfeD family protein [Hyphomicrobiaceae bacterium]